MEKEIYSRIQHFWESFCNFFLRDYQKKSNFNEIKQALMRLNPRETKFFTELSAAVKGKVFDYPKYQKLISKADFEQQFAELMKFFSEMIQDRSHLKRKSLGQITTPFPIIREIVEKILAIQASSGFRKPLNWLDVGCGPGFFISWVLVQEILQDPPQIIENIESQEDALKLGISKENYWCDLKIRLAAVDLDPLSIFTAKRFVSMVVLLLVHKMGWRVSPEIISKMPPIQFFTLDFLLSHQIPSKFNPDIILGNPPYIFSRNLPKDYRNKLRGLNYKSADGQFDISDVFVEKSLRILPENGVIGFIIPEIILSLSSRRQIRQILVDSSHYIFIKKVQETFQTASVENIELFASKLDPKSAPTLKIEFLDELGDNHTIFEGKKAQFSNLEQNVGQQDVLHIKNYLKNFESNEMMEKYYFSINDWNKFHPEHPIFVFRGVELSKKGEIVQCGSCGLWMPYSIKRSRCKHCNRPISQPITPKKIIYVKGKSSDSGINPRSNIKVAKFVQNFPYDKKKLRADSFIELGYPGIQYKPPEYYQKPRIVVRQLLHDNKICAAEIELETLTSQSIYHISIPPILEKHIPNLVDNLRSDKSAEYLFGIFSGGKRLFPRILLNLLKKLPFIPKNYSYHS